MQQIIDIDIDSSTVPYLITRWAYDNYIEGLADFMKAAFPNATVLVAYSSKDKTVLTPGDDDLRDSVHEKMAEYTEAFAGRCAAEREDAWERYA